MNIKTYKSSSFSLQSLQIKEEGPTRSQQGEVVWVGHRTQTAVERYRYHQRGSPQLHRQERATTQVLNSITEPGQGKLE